MSKTKRVEVIDALRAFSLLGIVLIHSIEHFNLYFLPESLPPFLKTVDRGVEKVVFFLFAGKAYAIFSLLFGFSFFVQYCNQRQRGYDFRPRFAWRMVLLLLFAQLDSLFYPGDILGLYAIVGFVLIMVSKWSDKAVFITAIVLILQPLEWAKVFYALVQSDYLPPAQTSYQYFGKIYATLTNGSFTETLIANIGNGQFFSNLWQVENGRLFQTSALFMFGLLLGRRELYLHSAANNLFWKKVLFTGMGVFLPLFFLNTYWSESFVGNAYKILNTIIVPSIRNFGFTLFLVASFILLWHRKGMFNKFHRFIIPYGRMSLTNYITMGMFGSFLFYGYGLSWYKYLGATQSMFVGIGIFIVQLYFSKWWLKRYSQGPLEYLWKRLTWMSFTQSGILKVVFLKRS